MHSDPERPAGEAIVHATDELFTQVYDQLKRLARGYLRRERPDHTLQPTALVHEAYVRLSTVAPGIWNDRKVFVGVAARAMRRVLIDHARRRRAGKRAVETVVLDAGTLADSASTIDVLALDQALDTLSRADDLYGQIVELHLFAGLTVRETADVLSITERTVYRKLRSARAWLQTELGIETRTPAGPPLGP